MTKGSFSFQDSPVEQLRKELPRGDGDWESFAHVYSRLSEAAMKMGISSAYRGGDMHVRTMAIMGSGDENEMKAHLLIVRSYGWLNTVAA